MQTNPSGTAKSPTALGALNVDLGGVAECLGGGVAAGALALGNGRLEACGTGDAGELGEESVRNAANACGDIEITAFALAAGRETAAGFATLFAAVELGRDDGAT